MVLKTRPGFVLHGPQGDCVSFERSGTAAMTDLVALSGLVVEAGGYIEGVQAMRGICRLATTARLSFGFFAYETSPNIFSSSIICFKNGMQYIGKTKIDSGIVPGDLIAAVDGVLTKGVVGDHVIGQALEPGKNSEYGYGTVLVLSFAQPRLMD